MRWIRLTLIPTTVVLLLAISLVVFSAIYVTGATAGLVYPGDLGKPVFVIGTVKIKNGTPYIQTIQTGLLTP